MIMEEVNSNPILTEEEVRELLEPESEEEIRREEELTEAIVNRIDFLVENGYEVSDEKYKQIVTEERIKRNML